MAAPRPARTATIVALPIALLAGVLVFWLMGGFGARGGGTPAASAPPRAQSTEPVTVPAASLDGRRAVVCRALLSRLPDALRDARRRPVTTGTEQNAAYGDPPITLACGGAPASVEPTATVYPLSGVCWYAEERADVTVWTTVDREVPVQVTVPRRYEAPGQWVIEFSAPVVQAVPSAPKAPTGCG